VIDQQQVALPARRGPVDVPGGALPEDECDVVHAMDQIASQAGHDLAQDHQLLI
jgi:hypothetical protein